MIRIDETVGICQRQHLDYNADENGITSRGYIHDLRKSCLYLILAAALGRSRESGEKNDLERITVLVCYNMTGTE